MFVWLIQPLISGDWLYEWILLPESATHSDNCSSWIQSMHVACKVQPDYAYHGPLFPCYFFEFFCMPSCVFVFNHWHLHMHDKIIFKKWINNAIPEIHDGCPIPAPSWKPELTTECTRFFFPNLIFWGGWWPLDPSSVLTRCFACVHLGVSCGGNVTWNRESQTTIIIILLSCLVPVITQLLAG